MGCFYYLGDNDEIILSEKDKKHPTLAECKMEFR